MLRTLRCVVLCMLGALAQGTGATTLVIESWRSDDKVLWDKVLIPAFERSHPGMALKFVPTAPTDYDTALAARLAGGSAGDIIACRPFDTSLALYRKGYLERLNGRAGMENFPASALVAWQTDDGRDNFCMPLASVIHGFFYNKKILRALNLAPPRTQAELFAVLDAVARQTNYTPLALGTADQWESSQVVLTNLGPNYWHGEEGRRALISGRSKFTDAPFVAAFDEMARLGAYMGRDAASQTYADSQALFASGRAALYPGGSWDLAHFSQVPGLEVGVFAPPVRTAGDKCYISDHMDIGLGLNRRSRHKAEALAFLAWAGSQEFADLYTNRATGFFSLSNHLIAVQDPLARQMLDWRNVCASTIRVNAQMLNREPTPLEPELWRVSSLVLNGKLSPADAAAQVQARLASSPSKFLQ